MIHDARNVSLMFVIIAEQIESVYLRCQSISSTVFMMLQYVKKDKNVEFPAIFYKFSPKLFTAQTVRVRTWLICCKSYVKSIPLKILKGQINDHKYFYYSFLRGAFGGYI